MVNEIGSIIEGEIFRGETDQGLVYKNFDNYETGEGICYVPELSDTTYTKKDILDICEGNERLARFIFDTIDWQSPETFLHDLYNIADEFPEFFEKDEKGTYKVKPNEIKG